MLTEIDVDTTQLFAGANLTQDDQCECTACNRILREGEPITIYAARKEDAPTYRIERIYCRDCTPEDLTSPTLGLSEHLLGGRLTRTLDVRTQRQFQTLHEPQTLATSAPSEGTAESHDEHEDPAALIRSTHSQNPASAIYHLDNGEGHSCVTAKPSLSTPAFHSPTLRQAQPGAVATARLHSRAAKIPDPVRAVTSRSH